MEIISGILAFLQIANLFFTVREKLELSKDQKQAVGNGLINIGNLIYSVAKDLSQGTYPAGKCHQMEIYAGELTSILDGKLLEKDQTKLIECLNQSLKVERLLGDLNNISLEAKDKNIELLEIAASSFIASGEVIKMK